MRPVAVLSSLAVLMVGSACATTNGTSAVSRYGSTQTTQRPVTSSLGVVADSMVAQAIANREGPRVSIRAQLSNAGDSRRVRGIFQLDDDAYVVVGHIDADGALRIAFPNEPSDDGFVRGGQSYQTNEFFAGFNAEYRFRASTSMSRFAGLTPDAYDGGLGYVFVIASWRPMRFDRFQTGGVWDSFEIADESYMRDPRPAIQELAALLAGENREAFTIKFARYYDTQTLYSGYSTLGSAYSAGYCSGYAPLGFAFSPFSSSAAWLFQNQGFGYGGSNFQYRGTNYYYDAAGDCYRTSPASFGYGYRIVQGPGVPTPQTPRAFAVDGHRGPPTPQPLPGHFFPKSGETTPGDETVLHSPEYRRRGLITEEASTGPVRRQPRVQGSTLGDERTPRPSLQDMVNRRGENAHDGTVGGRSRMATDNNGYDVQRQGGTQQTPRTRSEPGRSDQSPRVQAPERTSPPVRSEPGPRMQAPERTSPPPARSEPRSEPARVPPPDRPSTPAPAASSAPRSEPAVKPPMK